ncbi:MAG: AzlD domain-containing protein [Campylobacter sp.]|nr:AzlD domain-containing protein [Campylobacter sp.]
MISINSSELAIFSAVLLSAFATFLTRALPFYAIKNHKQSKWLSAVERHMGLMIMVILVFYALKDTKFNLYPYGLNEIIGVISAILIHLKFKNTLLSVVSSTAIYMLCLRFF